MFRYRPKRKRLSLPHQTAPTVSQAYFQSPQVKETAKILYESTLASNNQSRSTALFQSPQKNGDDMIRISSRVLEAMQNEADHEASYPTSLYHLADLWMTSRCVLDLHGNPTEEEYNAEKGHVVDLVKSIEKLSIDPDAREKALKKALRKLQTSVHSIEPNITCWEEAREKIASVLIFTNDDENQSEGNVQDETALKKTHYGRIKVGRPAAKKLKQSKVSMGVLDYFQLLCKSDTLNRWRSNKSSKWDQIAHWKVPEPISVQSLGDIEKDSAMVPLSSRDQKERDDSIETVTERMDKLLRKRIEEAESKAREKEILEAKRIEEEIKKREEDERKKEAEEVAKTLLKPLTDEESALVHTALWEGGPSDEKLATSATDSVQRKSMHTLRPGQWLNDEVIHYFFSVLAKRDEALSAAHPGRKRSHFFMSFFFTKLFDEGCTNKYTYGNVKRWTRNVPGKDIFALDKIFLPCNINMMHWTCVVIYMQEKRIQFYDSMGGDGKHYTNGLMRYLKDEWASKKGGELPDLDKWTIVGTEPEVPRQRNGYDCGVFTCMFADFLSMDRPLTFDQTDRKSVV